MDANKSTVLIKFLKEVNGVWNLWLYCNVPLSYLLQYDFISECYNSTFAVNIRIMHLNILTMGKKYLSGLPF